MTLYPKVTVELDATNRWVDVLNEGYDIAIRVRPFPLEDSGLVYKVLSRREQCLVAAPSILETYGAPKQPADLTRFPSMVRDMPNEQHQWHLLNERKERVTIELQPRYLTTDMLALKQAALKGVGVVQLPTLMLQTHLESGELVHLLPGWKPETEVIHCVFPTRRGMLPSVRALLDFLAERYAQIEET